MLSSIAGTAEARPELIASTIPILDVAPYLAGEPGARKRLGAELRWALVQSFTASARPAVPTSGALTPPWSCCSC